MGDAENGEVENLKEEKHELERKIDDLTEEIQDMEKMQKQINDRRKSAEQRIANMEKKNQWISETKDTFGQEDGDFDFEKWPYATVEEKLRKAEAALQKMDGKINK